MKIKQIIKNIIISAIIGIVLGSITEFVLILNISWLVRITQSFVFWEYQLEQQLTISRASNESKSFYIKKENYSLYYFNIEQFSFLYNNFNKLQINMYKI